MTNQLSRPSSNVKIFPHAGYDAVVEQRRRLKHLRRLAFMRYGRHWTLPNDVHGGNMLRAMLACGLTGPDAQRLAPKIGPPQLQDMIWSVESREWDGDALGNLVELEDDEREEGKLWSMRPCDSNGEGASASTPSASVPPRAASRERSSSQARPPSGSSRRRKGSRAPRSTVDDVRQVRRQPEMAQVRRQPGAALRPVRQVRRQPGNRVRQVRRQ
jgi:hypothetical protein